MREEDVIRLFEYAADQPDGFTYEDVGRDLGWTRRKLFDVARRLRQVFSEDEINLVCGPAGASEPWVWRLVGNYDDAREWVTNRVGDMETRIETIRSVAHSCVNASDGRTAIGRKARKIHRTMNYLADELAAIEED